MSVAETATWKIGCISSPLTMSALLPLSDCFPTLCAALTPSQPLAWLSCIAGMLLLKTWELVLVSWQFQLVPRASLKLFWGSAVRFYKNNQGRNYRKTFTSSIDWITLGCSHPSLKPGSTFKKLCCHCSENTKFPMLCLPRISPCCLLRLFKILIDCDISSGASLEKALGIEGEVCHNTLPLLARLRSPGWERNYLESLQSQSVYSMNPQVFVLLPGGEAELTALNS